jgi:hypothetical protein
MTDRHDFKLRPTLNWTVRRVGREQVPVITIDNVLQNPSDLVDYAAHEVAFKKLEDDAGGYPGVRAPAPLNYVHTLVTAVDPLIQNVFGLTNVSLANAECSFSIVTTPRDQLHPSQCVPHIDTTYPLQFALLHYLCGDRFGGTAFYRQKNTGFETIGENQKPAFDEAAQCALARPERVWGYVADQDPDYAQTAVFDAKFDRLLIYPSQVLHSGVIASETLLSADPCRGRLTANIFATYVQK